ncbi:MAG: hypothetical protein ACOY0T_25760 [Myxococcota bacterium]
MGNRAYWIFAAVSLPFCLEFAPACSSSSGDGSGGALSNGGSAGAQAKGGASAGGNLTGAGGTARAGAGGTATTSGGKSAQGGASGKGGAGTGGAGTTGGASNKGGAGGSGGRDCEAVQCLRAYECVAKCGGPVLSSGCCPCGGGTIDRVTECNANGGAGGEAGAGGGSGVDLSKLNSNCVNGTCPTGLTPTKFYGVAGPSGPEFCWCTIPCASSPNVCPSGTQCLNVADGPGQVCMKN